MLPSPKFQLYDVGLPVLWLVNDTVNGALPEGGDVANAATGAEGVDGGVAGAGGGGAVTVIIVVVLFDPNPLVAVRKTV